MAINFSQVKILTIPEGEVTKITDSSGNVLWQSQSWHTIWEGSKKIGYGGSTGDEILLATEPYSKTLKLRISFSRLYGSKPSGDEGSIEYIPSNSKSPVTYESFSSTNTQLVRADVYNSTRNASYAATLYYNKNTGKIYGSTYRSSNAGGNAEAYIVITKIEAYS